MGGSKSPGTDGLVNELFKEAFIIKHFNKIFNLGIFHARWGEVILCPLYKSGNIHEVNNYRGISLTSNFSKIFTKILNNRLVKWEEDNNLLYENQAIIERVILLLTKCFALYKVRH